MLIAIDDRGIPTLEIEDSKGEVHSYRIALAPRGLSRWAVQLDNLTNGESYRVMLEYGGWWRCSCPAWHFKHSKNHPRSCKHANAIKHLHVLITALSEKVHERPRDLSDRADARCAI